MDRILFWKTFQILSLSLLIVQMSESVKASTVLTITPTATHPTTSPTQTTTSSPIISRYSNSLSMASPTFRRPSGLAGYPYYYQAIQVAPVTSAQYNLSSSSLIDTYGCLYQHWFDPSNPMQNLISCDDDSGGATNFLISFYLQTSASYVLVVTTYNPSTTGVYTVLAAGPATVYMTSINPITTTTTTTRPFTTSSVTTTYSGRLSANSPTFLRPGGSSYNYYYQAIQTITYTSGSYTLRSYSSMDTYGCLYSGSFNPSSPDQNKLACDDDSGTSGQFLINHDLLYGATYILVVTTYNSGVIGDYSISVAGPGSVLMTSITPGPVQSFYNNGYLSSSSPTFTRPGGYSSDYYYNSIEVNANTSGVYTFESSSVSGTDLYGCLYIGSFDPSSPSANKLTCDDDSGGGVQFQFLQNLYSYSTYILVVTTSFSDRTGSYAITVTGPSSVSMRSITPAVPLLTTTQIIAITISCVVFFIMIAMIVCACRRKSRVPLSRQAVSPIQNPPRNGQYVPQGYVIGAPYSTARAPGYPVVVEEAPPSYQAYVSTLKP